MYESVFPYALGVLLAWVTWFPARRLDAGTEQYFFTTIITIVALGFIGFAIEDGSLEAIGYELGALISFLILIVLSRKVSLVFLPSVWIAHGAWDLVYLLGYVPVDKPLWVVQLCVPYDWILGAYLFRRISTWRGAS